MTDDKLTIEDLFRWPYVLMEKPGYAVTATEADLIAILEGLGAEKIESVSFAGIVGPDWEFSTDKPGTYLVWRIE